MRCRFTVNILLFCLVLSSMVGAGLAGPPSVFAVEYVSPHPYQRESLLTGFTRSRQVVHVTSEVSGKCSAISVDVGEPVPVGGLFAEIDDTFIKLDMAANRLQQERVERQLVTEKKMLKRYMTLREKNSATEAKLEEVELSADLHELTLKDLQTQEDRLGETLSRYRITAPEGWLLIERTIEPGEFVQTGQIVAQVGDYRQLVVPFALSYSELDALKKIGKPELYLPDLERRVEGAIHKISPSFSEQTKKIQVELIIDGRTAIDQEPLRGGLRAQLRLPLTEETHAFVLPQSAIINRYDAHWVLRENGERVRVIFLGVTGDGTSGIVSSDELKETDSLYSTIPADF